MPTDHPAAVIDTNVLYPVTLRDTLLHISQRGQFRIHWSAKILDELDSVLIREGIKSSAQVVVGRAALEAAFPDAMVRYHERHLELAKNAAGDRHVTAAALAAKASFVVTQNLDDFEPMPEGIVAISSDDFLCLLYQRDPEGISLALQDQLARYRRAGFEATIGRIFAELRTSAPTFVGLF